MIDLRVRQCVDCQRPTRPSKTLVKDYPDTIIRGSVDRCLTCHLKARGTATPRLPKLTPVAKVTVPAGVMFATIPDPRTPQQSDCRSACCRNPFTCGKQYQCVCHRRES